MIALLIVGAVVASFALGFGLRFVLDHAEPTIHGWHSTIRTDDPREYRR